ncbi:MAG: hypothetical protein ACYDCL_04030 [Myxococcales bacterium]
MVIGLASAVIAPCAVEPSDGEHRLVDALVAAGLARVVLEAAAQLAGQGQRSG